MKYVVEITETLQRCVEIYADDSSEAIEKVSADYYNGDIILDYSDYADTEFEILREESD